ncbi:MAG: hypothetical protein AB1733_01655 [Thermodesulfobacteriota bacterium]
MQYDMDELRKLARKMLPRAQKNLRKHGFLKPVGLAYRPDGFIDTFAFAWSNLDEKREVQRDFQLELLRLDAVAAVIISETWAKFAEDGPIDLDDQRSVRDMPGRKDALLIEAGSPFGRVVVVQTFTKIKPGKIVFDVPREFTPEMGDLTSEFLEAIWPSYEKHSHILH